MPDNNFNIVYNELEENLNNNANDSFDSDSDFISSIS